MFSFISLTYFLPPVSRRTNIVNDDDVRAAVHRIEAARGEDLVKVAETKAPK